MMADKMAASMVVNWAACWVDRKVESKVALLENGMVVKKVDWWVYNSVVEMEDLLAVWLVDCLICPTAYV